MNSLERVTLTLQHKEPDRVPVYPILSGVTRNLIGASYKTWATDAKVCSKALMKAAKDLELDCICTLTDLSVEAADFGQKIIYPENEAAFPDGKDYFIKTIEEYSKVKKINPRVTPRMSEHIKLCDILVKEVGQEKPIIAFIFGPLGIASMLRGQENLYMDIYDEPEVVKESVEIITQVLLEYCDALIETGVHAIMMDTLFASQCIMSKDMWMEFEGPWVKRIAEYIHNKGCMFMIHNCGSGIYFDVQIEMMRPEAISFDHIPDDCSSYEETQEKYGSTTTLIGHVSPQWVVTATPEEVREECIKQMNIHKKNGGFMLATGCEYPANASLENAKVMVDVAKNYGKY
jgi:uroporphyrinogen decarboxylase